MSGFSHYSVLLEESVDLLEVKPDGVYVDCTLGGGGHSECLARRLSEQGRVIAIDRGGSHYLLKERLRDLENILPAYFIRINKSTLANEHRILRFDAAFSGGVDAVFLCGYREYVSRRCFSEIKRRYEGV